MKDLIPRAVANKEIAIFSEALMKAQEENKALEAQITALQEQMSRLAEQHAKAVAEFHSCGECGAITRYGFDCLGCVAVAEAREEQREHDARLIDEAGFIDVVPGPDGMGHERPAGAMIRATPLDSTPLAARIAELEREKKTAYGVADRECIDRRAAESALAAEVERHQATVKERDGLKVEIERADSLIVDLDAAKERLRDLVYEVVCRNGGLQKRDPREMFADLAAAFRETASPVPPVASLPAGPREVR